jgi:hypothetical protein
MTHGTARGPYVRLCGQFTAQPHVRCDILVDMCAKMSLSAQREQLGVKFTPDSPYLVPGFLSAEDSTNEVGGLCLLFTTFNSSLYYVRTTHWFTGKVTLAYDHTFKMDVKDRPHFTINVMVSVSTSPCVRTLCFNTFFTHPLSLTLSLSLSHPLSLSLSLSSQHPLPMQRWARTCIKQTPQVHPSPFCGMTVYGVTR